MAARDVWILPIVLAGLNLFGSYALPTSNNTDYSQGVILSHVKSDKLQEISGVAASRKHPGILWVLNDSGAKNKLYALNITDGTRETFDIEGATNCDWEDIAIGPGEFPGTEYIYIGDIGGNADKSCLTVYRVVEPDDVSDGTDLNVNADFSYEWPENNCETLMVDPAGKLYLVSKTEPGSPVKVYEVPGNAWDQEGKVQLTEGSVVNIELEKGADGPVAGDISSNGREILLKTYNNIYLYTQSNNQEKVAATLAKQPKRLYYNVEEQGESIAWDPQGEGFYTISEGKNPAIWYYTPLEITTPIPNQATPLCTGTTWPGMLLFLTVAMFAAY